MSGARDDNMDKTQYKPADTGQPGTPATSMDKTQYKPGPGQQAPAGSMDKTQYKPADTGPPGIPATSMDKTQYKPAPGQQAAAGPMDKTQYKPAAGQQAPVGPMDKTQYKPAAGCLDKTQMMNAKAAGPLDETQALNTTMIPAADGNQPVVAAPAARRRRIREESTLFDAPSLVDWVVAPNRAKDMQTPQPLFKSRLTQQPQPTPTVPKAADDSNRVKSNASKLEGAAVQFEGDSKRNAEGAVPDKPKGLYDLMFPPEKSKTPPPKD